MVPHDELIMMGVGLIAVAIAWGHRRHLARVRDYPLLLAGFGVLWVGWIATAVEHLLLPDFFNHLEHTAYLIGALLIAIWCWRRPLVREMP